VPYVRTVTTASGATAVQIVYSSRRGSRDIEHIGSARDDAGLELLKAAARQRLAAGQGELDLGLDTAASGGPLPVTSSRMGCLLDGLTRAYDVLGLGAAAGGDEVFRDLVLARIIEPASKLDSLRVLEEAGVTTTSYRTVLRRLPAYAKEAFRQELSAACAAHARLGPASLVLYDVSTLYFETDAGDGFREPGFSKERRLEPQITIGLLTGQDGFPLMVSAFEGNKAETKTMLPVIEKFMAARQLPDVTVVADAGMISEANQKAIEAAGLSFILGMKIPDIPYAVAQWRREHPGEEIPDGHVFTQPWPAGPKDKRRDQVIYYQYRADRARRTLRGIDEQVAKAAKAVAGLAPVKRNRFIQLDGAAKSVNRELEARARTLAGIKGYVTNLAVCPDGTPVTADFVIGSYHELWKIEMVFTQLAKRSVRASGGGWQDVADLDLVLGDDDAVDEQLDQLPPLLEAGGGEPGPDGLAECLDTVGDGLEFEPLPGRGVQLALLGEQGGVPAVQVLAFALEFGQRDDLGEVGVQQPLLLALELAQGLADGRLPGLELLGQPGPALGPGQRAGDLSRIGQQRAQVGPDQLIELPGGNVAGGAAPSLRRAQCVGAPAAQVVAVASGELPAGARQPARAAADQRAQQVLVPGIAGCALLVDVQLVLHLGEDLLRDDRRDRHRDPVLFRSRGMGDARSGRLQRRLAAVGRRGPGAVGHGPAGIGRVAQDAAHAGHRPERLARRGHHPQPGQPGSELIQGGPRFQVPVEQLRH
jgi:Transposase DDE domain